MSSVPATALPASRGNSLPPPHVCEQARLSRDPRFDGLFFTAVTSTGIYCRPVCPAPRPKRDNVVYFGHAAAAEAAGYRPCLRCRPELAPGDGTWRRGDATVARALKLIDEGALAEQPIAALAQRVGIGERQLRRLFVERLGATPQGVHATRRLLFAKQLLTETRLPISEIALASGFGSLRRFNAVFLDAYRMPPRNLRRSASAADATGETLTLRLGYRPPYDFGAMLDFLRGRALPGMEVLDGDSYARVLSPVDGASGETRGWLRVSPWPGGDHALKLELHRAPSSRLLEIVGRVRRMFDLDADPQAIAGALSSSPRLRPLLKQRPGLHIPSGWDGFEIAIRAIIGQQISVVAARTITTRLIGQFSAPLPAALAPGLDRAFPTAETLADADLGAIGLTRSRAQAVRTAARAILDGRVDFRGERTLDDFTARWTSLPGIGPWTAQYVAIRALGHPDAFPADDLVLQRTAINDGTRRSAKVLREVAEAWRPWRGYAVIHLWRDAKLAANTTSRSSRHKPARTQKPGRTA